MAERGIAFEEVVRAIESGELLAILDPPNPERYPGQRISIVKIREYADRVPYVEDETEIFLKTIIPSRKMQKRYLGG
ncbi:DUF4258 domain-containing protein [Pannus brasiliensis CCIBt3594]|uniref:DUF4258 domain-containing protein n=1 Tax=Pannus brasiliensis CCIBt3594 TaxID=1427578 RepID=A0AAW9QYA8_9CHRO